MIQVNGKEDMPEKCKNMQIIMKQRKRYRGRKKETKERNRKGERSERHEK
jgi:hypothetical protein